MISTKVKIGKIVALIVLLNAFHFSRIAAQDISWNDECKFAYTIDDVSDFCSDTLDFSNNLATVSKDTAASCWPREDIINGVQQNFNKDVWFTFRPDKSAMLVRLFGAGSFNGKTIDNPQFVIYTGTCGNLKEVACGSVLGNQNFLELNISNIVVGTKYFLRIAARDGKQGSYRLCINTFPTLKSPEADCPRGNILCDKSPYSLKNLRDIGIIPNEVANTCIQEEFASVWLKWVIKDPGSLTFTIFPNNNTDDLDWALYLLPNGLDDCAGKKLVRCNAAGETIGASQAANAPCMGPTGLSTKSTDLEEGPGCMNNNDNFVAAVNTKVGETYALIVNNFSQSGNGFSLRFAGTTTFQGPDINIDVSAVDSFECDKSIILENKVVTQVDSITNYSWLFGQGANIPFANTAGPHNIVYDTYGDKVASLTIESQRGCVVTRQIKFFVDPCCLDFSQLESTVALTEAIRCPGEKNGAILVTSTKGTDPLKYSITGNNYQLNPNFRSLGEGPVKITVEDAKGCTDTIEFVVPEATSIAVDLGLDQNLDAGTPTSIEPILSPPDVDFTWVVTGTCNLDGFNENSLNQNITPFGEYTFILSGVSSNGCTQSDTLIISAFAKHVLYTPNIISKSGNSENQIFSLSSENDSTNIIELAIFDRWGNQVFYNSEMSINDGNFGWDGTFNGQIVAPGVYAWMARIRYIDCIEKTFHGDLTVIR